MRSWLALVAAVAVVALCAVGSGQEQPRIQVLILTGQNNHDWRATTPVLRDILQRCGRFEVRVNEEPRGCGPETFAPYDVLLTNYNGPRWGERTEQALLDFVRAGKGFVVIHAADNAFGGWDEYDKLIGPAWRAGAGHTAYHSFVVTIEDPEHPITKGMHDFQHAPDELYQRLTVHPEAQVHVLASAYASPDKGGTGKKEPQAVVLTYGQGRCFQLVLGHSVESMKGVGFAALLQRGTEWAATGQVTLPAPTDLPPPEGPK